MNKRTFAHTLAAGVLALAYGSAQATVIYGEAVRLDGTHVEGGTSDPIDFFIPISEGGSGLFGYGAGQTADHCNASYQSCAGWLGMALKFSPVVAGAYQMSLEFDDLDLAGFNDPDELYEALLIYTHPDLNLVFHSGNPLVHYSSNDDTQKLLVDVNVAGSGDYYVGLLFGAEIFSRHGKWQNTEETLVAKLKGVSVPEPASLSLLGAGLLAMGFVGRRRRKHVV